MKSTLASQHSVNSSASKVRSVRYRVKCKNYQKIQQLIIKNLRRTPTYEPPRLIKRAKQPRVKLRWQTAKRAVHFEFGEKLRQLNGLSTIAQAKSIKMASLQNSIIQPSIDKESSPLQKIHNWQNYSRVQLPLIESTNSSSAFTILDPFMQQYNFVQTMIHQTNKSLSLNRMLAKDLLNELKIVPVTFSQKLDKVKKDSALKLQQFSKLLRQESVIHHESTLRARQAIVQLSSDFQIMGRQFDEALSRTQDTQQLIFRTLPFELVENTDEIQSFPEKLF